jgi:hypothetical protein
MAKAIHSRPKGQDQFAGVSDWPDIDELFAARSLSILAGGGISAWYGSGGRRGHDGRLGFGAVSSPALEIIRELAAMSGGFRWTDDVGATWAVRFVPGGSDDPDHSAVAMTYRGCVWPMDSRRRGPTLRTLKAQAAGCTRLIRSWNDADRARFGSLSRAVYSLRLVEGVERMLGYLVQHGHGGHDGCILLSAEEMGAAVRQDADQGVTINELAAVLRATMGFEIAQLHLGHLGWNPRFVRQSAAVTEVQQISDEAFRIRVSPMFNEVMSAFSRKAGPPKACLIPTRIARLAQTSAIVISQERRTI